MSFQPSCSLLFSPTPCFSLSFDQVLFPSCLLGRQAWLLGSGLPFKCCFYCSTVTDHWPETGVAMGASASCTTHTFPNDAHWKGDFLPVWSNTPAWQCNALLVWIQQSWALKTRNSCARSDEETVMSNFTCVVKGGLFQDLRMSWKNSAAGKTYFCCITLSTAFCVTV